MGGLEDKVEKTYKIREIIKSVQQKKGGEEIIKGIIKDCLPKLKDTTLNTE